jgi:hypothetical protein
MPGADFRPAQRLRLGRLSEAPGEPFGGEWIEGEGRRLLLFSHAVEQDQRGKHFSIESAISSEQPGGLRLRMSPN